MVVPWPVIVFFLISVIQLALGSSSSSNGTGEGHHENGIHLASWNWSGVGIYLTVTIFVVLSGLAKVGFHHVKFLSSRIPESCLLVAVGLVMGAIVSAASPEPGENCGHEITDRTCPPDQIHILFPSFTPELFFYFLLPPIILEASYSLYDHVFFNNLSTILVMAVIGTAINFLLIGFLLFAVFQMGAMGSIRGILEYRPNEPYNLTLLQVLLFASLISAVDPVAVLAIFQEVGVNPDLYFLVFGESLLNDGVAVVFYKTMNTLATMEHNNVQIGIEQYFLGLVSFLTVAVGGLIVGIIVGFLTALITKTTREVRVMEPLALLGMAYFAYMAAELFHWSGIISLIGCGLIQAHYAFKNISKKSHTTVKYFIKMASSTSDITIFLFLGIALVKGDHFWHTGFIAWTLCFCLICRFLSVYGLIWIANKHRVKAINLQEQFIMAYGGLRGAVGFSLVEMISSDIIPPRQMFVTTTLAVVMFTIFFQGGTIKFLVNLLNIDKKKDEVRLISEEVNDTVIEHIMSGVDVISGKRGKQYFQTLLEYYDDHYLKRIFCTSKGQNELTRLFEKLALSDHLVNLYGPTLVHEEGQGAMLLKPVESTDLIEDVSAHDQPRQGSSSSEYATRRPSKKLNPRDRLLKADNYPPPIPPRERSNSIIGVLRPNSLMASFRHRGRSDAASMQTLSVPNPDALRRRRPSKEDLDLVRNAFKKGTQRRLNRNDVDDSHHQDVYSHLKKRHVKARRISRMMLIKQHTVDDLFANQRTGDRLGSDHRTRTHHPSLTLEHAHSVEEEVAGIAGRIYDSKESDEESCGNDVEAGPIYLTRVPENERPGVEAVLRRHQQRVRSLSVSSSSEFDPAIAAAINEMSRSPSQKAGMNITQNPMAQVSDSSKSVGSSPSKSIASPTANNSSTTAPVERRKNANGRRKLTPHPLAPSSPESPDQQQQSSTFPTIESKLSILDEDEECRDSIASSTGDRLQET